MNNRELIKEFFNRLEYFYRYGMDYFLCESGDYIIICPFNKELMVSFNKWLVTKCPSNYKCGEGVLYHCTSRDPMYFYKYLQSMLKRYTNPIKCYAFKAEGCVFKTISLVDKHRETCGLNKRVNYMFDECTYWIDADDPSSFIKLHTCENIEYTDIHKGMKGLAKHNLPTQLCEEFMTKISSNLPIIPIDNNILVSEYKKYQKTLKYS